MFNAILNDRTRNMNEKGDVVEYICTSYWYMSYFFKFNNT